MCVHACPQHIISMSKEITVRGYFFAQLNDPSRCLGCRLCAITCPDTAISVLSHGTTFALIDY